MQSFTDSLALFFLPSPPKSLASFALCAFLLCCLLRYLLQLTVSIVGTVDFIALTIKHNIDISVFLKRIVKWQELPDLFPV